VPKTNLIAEVTAKTDLPADRTSFNRKNLITLAADLPLRRK